MLDSPRPTRLLTINSVIVISGCIFLFSIGLGTILGDPNPCAIPGALIIMLTSFWIGVVDYLAVFRRNDSSARHAGILLYIGSGFFLFGAISTLAEWVFKSPVWSAGFFLFVCGMAFFGGYFFFSGRQLRRWGKGIQAWQNNRDEKSLDAIQKKPPFQFSLSELLGLVTVIGAISSITVWTIRSQPPQFIEHATTEQAGLSLPEGASDVCCARGVRGMITYEFTIDEEGFFEWAKGLGSLESKAANVPIRPIRDEFRFSRYTNYGNNMENFVSGNIDEAVITRGHYYSWSKEDRKIEFAYDKDRQHAYYHAHFH